MNRWSSQLQLSALCEQLHGVQQCEKVDVIDQIDGGHMCKAPRVGASVACDHNPQLATCVPRNKRRLVYHWHDPQRPLKKQAAGFGVIWQAPSRIQLACSKLPWWLWCLFRKQAGSAGPPAWWGCSCTDPTGAPLAAAEAADAAACSSRVWGLISSALADTHRSASSAALPASHAKGSRRLGAKNPLLHS